MDYAATPPPLADGKNWQNLGWDEMDEILSQRGIDSYKIAQNSNADIWHGVSLDEQNHQKMTQSLYKKMLRLPKHVNTSALFQFRVDDIVSIAGEFISTFLAVYKALYPTRIHYNEFVKLTMSSFERSEGVMQYEATKRRCNEHANMTLAHYEAMLLHTMQHRPKVAISQEEAEAFVREAGTMATLYQERYDALYPKLQFEDEMREGKVA